MRPILWISFAALLAAPRAPGDFADVAAGFSQILAADSDVVEISGPTVFTFTEGPVWSASQGRLIFSDNQDDKLYQWTPAGGVSPFRDPSQAANGNTRDVQGRLITCEQASRSVTRTESNGSITTLVSQYNSKLFNSPNDVAVKSDGTIWFTDPDYGLTQLGNVKEQPGNYVYRFDPSTGGITAVEILLTQPNGICFSPDESKLYVTDTGSSPNRIRIYDVQPGGTLANGADFTSAAGGGFDGLRCDTAGRVFTSASDGVRVYLPNGSYIGRILFPEQPANVTFGGPDGRTLFVTARTGLYKIHLAVLGAGVAGGNPMGGGGGGGGGGCGATGLDALILLGLLVGYRAIRKSARSVPTG